MMSPRWELVRTAKPRAHFPKTLQIAAMPENAVWKTIAFRLQPNGVRRIFIAVQIARRKTEQEIL